MDRYDNDDIDAQESANYELCLEAATHNGLTKQQAEACDAGEHNCPECPWRGIE